MEVEALQKAQEDIMSETTPLFDEFGRCLPTGLSSHAHQKTRRYFLIDKPEIDYAASYQRLNQAFAISDALSQEQFEKRVSSILDGIANDESMKAILNGVKVPFILPKALYDDIGHAMDTVYLPAVASAFHTSFPKYEFKNHSANALNGQLKVADNSRHQNVLEQMASDVVVGVYFPCLLEYSVPAAVERISSLPKQFSLAGGFDTSAAFISMPNLLLRKEGYPPLLWLSGLASVEENVAYHYEAYGYDLNFNRRVHLGQVAEYWASGITVTS
ncbi:MAG TPA: hypothetical protein ENI26_08525 [Methylophaga aminisulfidivorans]|uniref:Uncharacterized protein n=1 Tax=Methylophaga aminisulfidivorans TaxID=230105 RepID=A0A7C1ZQK7_9GAMM|nr:hypothetical protein [Methylophaga aminisulfidivorans]